LFAIIGDRVKITLSDKTTINFTGMGAFYPNDIGIQRNCLIIDYELKGSSINFNPDFKS